MKARSLKIGLILFIYGFAVLSVIGLLVFSIISVNNYFKETSDFDYSINGIINTSKDVMVMQSADIVKPYVGDNVYVGREYYEKEESSSNQERAIIFYENTYLPNTGVDYVSDNTFDVVSVLPGKVIYISSDENLGNIVKIKHENDIVSVYEGIDDISVKVDEEVSSGQKIAKSSISNINKEFNSSLHFEVFVNNENINPNKFYDLIVKSNN